MKSRMEVASENFSRVIGTSPALFVALLLVVGWMVTLEWPQNRHDLNSLFYEAIVMAAFLRVFFLERARYKEMRAVHLKLNELLAAQRGASNELIGAERAPEKILDQVDEGYSELKSSSGKRQSTSIEGHPSAGKMRDTDAA